jgi:hypothetical protein
MEKEKVQQYPREPAHHRNLKNPCECGARWETDGTGYKMDHILPCAYLESVEYGASRELR